MLTVLWPLAKATGMTLAFGLQPITMPEPWTILEVLKLIDRGNLRR